MKTENEELFEGVGAIVAIIFTLLSPVIGAISNGFVLTMLWSWFVVPIFNVDELPFVLAIGLMVTSKFMTESGKEEKYGDKKSVKESLEKLFGIVIVNPLLVLLIGWIISLFL